MSERRNTSRVNLLDFQPVYDARTGKVVGYLGDISADGLKLLSRHPIPLGPALRLRLGYVRFGGEAETPEVDAESVWQRREEGQAFVETGLRMRVDDPATAASIERIVADLHART